MSRSRIPRRAARYQPSNWLRNVVIGLDDGLVTTLVTFLTLTNITTHLLLVMLAVVLANALSMAISSFASAYLSRDAGPVLQGLETGVAFLVGGAAPLLPEVLQLPDAQLWSYMCAICVALTFGALKARKEGAFAMIKSALFCFALVSTGALLGALLGRLLGGA